MKMIKYRVNTNQFFLIFFAGWLPVPFIEIARLYFLRLVLLIFFFFCIPFCDKGGSFCFSQCGAPPPPALSFINPSFEGPSCAGCQPGPWVNCGGTPDTQPGSWGFTQPASDGNSYVSFLLAGAAPGGYFEGSSQALSACMTAGQSYSFSIDLAHSDIYNTAGPGDCYSSLEILGSNGLCAESEVLWQSGPITSTAWQTYSVTLTPTSNWCFVSFRPYWISACNGYVNISMDNLGPLETGAPLVSATVNADISCSQNILGTTVCPADSIILTGLFSGPPIHATILTDSTWEANVSYSLGASASQTIYIEAFFTIGGSLYDSITFNLVDITPDFSSTSVCAGNVTTFTDNSTASSGAITGWYWNFGDLSPAVTSQNPTHTYATPGSYNVFLMINTSDGCTDTITKTIQVYFNPIASFSHTDVCLGDTLFFTNTSTVDNSSSIVSDIWSFGDNGPTSNVQNPHHYYTGAGAYAVTLVSTTIDGCSDTSNISVNVLDSPSSAFIYSNSCLSDSVVFTNTSTNSIIGNTTGWGWDFGDGSAPDTSNWNSGHQYAAPGNYQVSLVTYSSNPTCADTLNDTIIIFPSPIADFDFMNVCLEQEMSFTDSSTVLGGIILSRSWDFGDSSPLSPMQNPMHTYSSLGTFSVSLVTTTDNNCKDTITKNVLVHPLPNADYSAPPVCDGSDVQFNDLSIISTPDTIQSWRWNFGDGSPLDINQNTSHLYNTSGSYSAQLLVVSGFGCLDSTTQIITVNPNPSVSFTVDDSIGCEPFCVSFQSISNVSGGTIAQQLWSFGNGSTNGVLQNPSFCYSNDSIYAPNYYTVTLTVTSESGCVTSVSKNNYITVYPRPNANFVVQPDVAPITNPVISITNLSSGANFWNWNFGDTDSSNLLSPVAHVYPDSGTYIITLITSTHYHCVDTAYQTIIIEPDYIFYVPNAFTPNGDGINDNFTGSGILIKEFEMSIFDRWGNLIFFSDDINRPWDGKANNGQGIAQADVYVYVVKITDFNRRKHDYKGIVTLLR